MKSFAKINVFLKVVGTRGNYHEILSRFVLCEQLFDEIYFEKSNSFAIECDNKEIKENIIQRMQLPIGKCNRDNQNQCKRIQCYFIQTVKNGKQSSVMKGGQK